MSEPTCNPGGRKAAISGSAVASLALGIFALMLLILPPTLSSRPVRSEVGIFATIGLVSGIISLMKVKNSKWRKTGISVAILGFIINGLLILLIGFELWYDYKWKKERPIVNCQHNLNQLNIALHIYNQENGSYPLPDKWCDLLLQNDLVVNESVFVCRAAAIRGDEGRSQYAINLKAKSDSPLDVVLLFETKGGWNQYGGSELLTMDNHEGKGCNVLLCGGDVKYVKNEELEKLLLEDPGIHKAIIDGDIDELKSILTKRPFLVNLKNRAGESPMHLAVQKSKFAMLEFLISHGANIEARDNAGRTPLHLAASKEKKDLAQFLVSHNAHVNAEGNYGRTPLWYAAEGESMEMVEFLIESDAVMDCGALHRAAGKGNRSIVEFLLTKGADVNFRFGKSGTTALHVVAQEDFSSESTRIEMTQLLISRGANVNSKDKGGNTPLHLAVKRGWKSTETMSEVLLANGADIHSKDGEGKTVLDIAEEYALRKRPSPDALIRRNRKEMFFLFLKYSNFESRVVEDKEVVKRELQNRDASLLNAANEGQRYLAEFLIRNRADINATDAYKSTPLHLTASQRGTGEVAELLIASGAKLNATDRAGVTPLDVAVRWRNTDVADVLRKHGGIRIKEWFNILTAGDVSVIEPVLAKDSTLVNIKNNELKSPLHVAVESGLTELAELLLARGAEVNARDNMGLTPLHSLLESDHNNDYTELVRLLIANGADVNAKDIKGRTPLHKATEFLRNFQDTWLVELLIAEGADVNAGDNKGQTPLLKALEWPPYRNQKEVVEFLLNLGADTQAKDSKGFTSLEYASGLERDRIPDGLFDLLFRHGAFKGKKIHEAVYQGKLEMVESILEEEPESVNFKTYYFGKTPLHIAVEQGNSDMVRVLIANGANINAKTYHLGKGITPLQLAVEKNSNNMVVLLLTGGANVEVPDDIMGNTALHKATQYGHKNLVILLLANGAEVNPKNKFGVTPLFFAANMGDIELVRLLMDNGAEVNVNTDERAGSATPLHCAAREGHKNVVELLLTSGADFNARDKDGRTPLDLATKYGHTEASQALRKHLGKSGKE